MTRSAYLHIPFCTHRCGYCNFTVTAGRADLVDPFLDALETEMARTLQQPQTMDTIFWGGGTPTYLSPQQMTRLIEMTHRWLPLAADGEWSCEANPVDCAPPKLSQMRQAGINRVSIGGQSFNADKLRLLERDHTPDQLRTAITQAREQFPQVSLDLIFAAPGETVEQWDVDLHQALQLGVEHISTYGLTIEQGSAFFGRRLRGQLQTVDEAIELQMYQSAIDILNAAGLEHYEVSNFARPGKQCRHNMAYWLGKSWYGFGPGAAAFDGRTRTVNHRSLHSYLKRVRAGDSTVAERDELSDEQLARERFVFGMRQLSGVDLDELVAVHGLEPESFLEPHLTRAVESGWFERTGSRVRLTRAGLFISDALWPEFL